MSFSLGNLGRGLGSLSDRIRRSTKGDDAAVVLGGSGGGGGSKAAPGPAPGASPSPALDPASGVLLGARPSEEEVEAALADLAPGYFDPPGAFDALEHELRCLPVDFGSTQLEDVADARTGVLEVVSEKLSAHVIENYAQFVQGVNEVTQVESELQAAHVTVKQAREALALAQREVASNLKISSDTRRKQGLTALLEALLKLQQAASLQRALKEAQEGGEFAEAFWLCAQCVRSMEELGEGLAVAQQLTATINGLYADTATRLEAALAAVCGDFRPAHYTKVLEGYMFLGNVAQLGEEVQSAFIATVSTSVTKVVRGVLLTRPGYEDKAAAAGSLQELLRALPADLFRTCLARVLMVMFDILVSHFHMMRWHEAALERHQADLAGLQATRAELQQRLGGGSSGSPGSAAPAAQQQAQHPQQAQQQQPLGDLLGLGGGHPLAQAQAPELEPVWGGSGEAHPPVMGRAVMELQRGTASELEEVEARASDEQEWGAVLQAVHAGLLAGRRLIWDEAARRIGVLLSSPAAFEGEHFLQVMDWTQRALAVGEAFSGCECGALRGLLERQSAKFFRLYHHSNIEALSSMLDQEMWKRLPASLPSLADALAARSSSADEAGSGGGPGGSPGPSPGASVAGLAGNGSSLAAAGQQQQQQQQRSEDYLICFERVVVQGNPWRKQHSPRRRRAPPLPAGLPGADAGGLAGRPAVDEYGVPLSAGGTPSAAAAEAAAGVGSRPGSAESGATAGSRGGTEGEEAGLYAASSYGELTDDDGHGTGLRRFSSTGSGAELAPGGGGGGSAEGAPAVTASSLRMVRWMRDYAGLMRPLRAAAPGIFGGLCELFELYLLHVFVTFSDVSIAELQAAAAAQHAAAVAGHPPGSGGPLGGGAAGGSAAAAGQAALSPRLRATLLRIASDSIGKYRQLFAAQSGSRLARALAGPAASPGAVSSAAPAAAAAAGPGTSASTHGGIAAQYFRRTLPGAGAAATPTSPPMVPGIGPSGAAAHGPGAPGAAPGGAGGAPSMAAAAAGLPPPAPAVEISAVSNAGNLYGLLERVTAVECLLAAAARLQAARGGLAAALPPGAEGSGRLDAFFSRTVGAAEDLRDFVVGTGVRLLLPLRWVPERLGAASWELGEPPTGHGAWVDDLARQLDLFRDRLAQAHGLERGAVVRLWAAAAAHVAEAMLEGFARCRRCSLEGRAAMSLDLQGVARALGRLLPPEAPPNPLRLVDTYIKAFYIPLTELPHWAQTHPEYSSAQVLALTACIAESSGLKKRDKAALLAQIEGHLRALAPGPLHGLGGAGGAG